MSNRRVQIDKLIINSPYEEPGQHWKYDRETQLFDMWWMAAIMTGREENVFDGACVYAMLCK